MQGTATEEYRRKERQTNWKGKKKTDRRKPSVRQEGKQKKIEITKESTEKGGIEERKGRKRKDEEIERRRRGGIGRLKRKDEQKEFDAKTEVSPPQPLWASLNSGPLWRTTQFDRFCRAGFLSVFPVDLFKCENRSSASRPPAAIRF